MNKKKKIALIQGPTTNVWNCVWNYLKFCITATSPTSPLGWTKAAVLVAIRRRSYDMFKMHTNWCISIRTGKAIYIRFALILSNRKSLSDVALVCNIKILFCILKFIDWHYNDESCIFTFGRSRRPKIERYLAFGRIPKPKPNVEFFLQSVLMLSYLQIYVKILVTNLIIFSIPMHGLQPN